MSGISLSSDRAFYSLQGEGPTVGVPAVFFRVAGCTLNCQWCDTADVWKDATMMPMQEAYGTLAPFFYYLDEGAHLVLTGGSPLRQQKALAELLAMIRERHLMSRAWYIECETEGVLFPDELGKYVNQWNVSPKLANSGMPFDRRFKKEVLRHHTTCGTSYFKFPVELGNEALLQEQLDEIRAISAMCGILKKYIYLMPVCNTRESHRFNSLVMAEVCKKYGYSLGLRLHLELWDKATGV